MQAISGNSCFMISSPPAWFDLPPRAGLSRGFGWVRRLMGLARHLLIQEKYRWGR
jgi:hypothetical protein